MTTPGPFFTRTRPRLRSWTTGRTRQLPGRHPREAENAAIASNVRYEAAIKATGQMFYEWHAFLLLLDHHIHEFIRSLAFDRHFQW